MDYIMLGKRIKEERLKLNLTQEQLAEAVNISTSYMGQIERGERNVTLDTLLRITYKLNVSVDYILNDYESLKSDAILNQFQQLLDGKSLANKQMALDVIRTMFSHLSNSN
ncbi:helix-turn-helix transcriptional regulator [Clostridium sp. C2-6-12]|uniref:helix-turn-helix domain-containing protein n=1 Tax=Clostridium sp. C2-6-12 TaxID=2698832 RepID=UPI0013709306|nr:helix-turn-helix transcriptional regulator [Clostridium sp. C2-6-12]